jgi:hypothetical protein
MGMMASICNPSSPKAEIRKITIESQMGKKVSETPISISKKLGVVVAK